MLRPDSQPLAGFEAGYSFIYDKYTVQNFTQAVCRKELGNSSIHDILL